MNDHTEMIQEKLSALLDFYRERELVTLKGTGCFEKTFAVLERARKEFDANLFFVLMFGPLKAGKSTLTNLLAGEYVSPTCLGIETTVRPSIIIKSHTTEYTIDTYYMRNPEDDKGTRFDQVIDTLRGISDFRNIEPVIRKESCHLTEHTVREQLIEPLTPEPLITVLKVPGGKLVTEQIALIDMPGLDGIKSNWRESAIHKWILERADFLIFIQSSMAALNAETFEFLKNVYEKSKRPPLWLVQNIIDAKPWRSESEREKMNSDQQRQAREQIYGLLKVTGDLNSTAINLGKASDGVERKDERLLEESKFISFENQLKEQLDNERIRVIQQENSVKGVGHALGECIAEFDRAAVELANRCRQIDAGVKDLSKPLEIFTSIKLDPSKASERLKSYYAGLITSWETTILLGIADLEESLRKKYGAKAGDLKERVEAVLDKIRESAKGLLETDSYKAEINALAQGYLNEQLGDTQGRLNDCLRELKIAPYEERTAFKPQMEVSEFVLPRETGTYLRKAAGGFDLERLFKREEAFENYIAKACEAFADGFREYCGQLKRDIESRSVLRLGDWLGEYKNAGYAYLKDQTANEEDKLMHEKDVLESTMGYVKHVSSMCVDLKSFVENGASGS